jgi:hypothetical protein
MREIESKSHSQLVAAIRALQEQMAEMQRQLKALEIRARGRVADTSGILSWAQVAGSKRHDERVIDILVRRKTEVVICHAKA